MRDGRWLSFERLTYQALDIAVEFISTAILADNLMREVQ